MSAMNDFQFVFKLKCLTNMYGDGASNTVEENSNDFSLIRMH